MYFIFKNILTEFCKISFVMSRDVIRRTAGLFHFQRVTCSISFVKVALSRPKALLRDYVSPGHRWLKPNKCLPVY